VNRSEPLPYYARPWRIWRPLFAGLSHRDKALRLSVVLYTLLLLSPYLLTNHIAHSRAGGESPHAAQLDHPDSFRVSRQDERTVWDPKTLFVDKDGRFLDYQIPFIDWSILIYITIFAYYFLGPLSAPAGCRGRWEMLLLVQSVVLISLAANLFFLFLPAQTDLRWQVEEQLTSWLAPFYQAFHWLDRPFNSWPSLHVAQTMLVVFCVRRWWLAQNKKWQIYLLWPSWLLLALSVLTTKQHFMWDLLTGLLLGLCGWLFLLRPGLRCVRRAPGHLHPDILRRAA